MSAPVGLGISECQMTLLSIKEIQQGLDREFAPLEPMIAGLRLVNGGVSNEAIVNCERELGVAFCDTFRSMIERYDFGRLTIGPIVFCNTGNYLGELVQLNAETWWGKGPRPKGAIVVANSDPFIIILDMNIGTVHSMDAERGWSHSTLIAREFDLFFRGVGTTMLCRSEMSNRDAFARDIATAVGGTDIAFWLHLGS